MQRIKGVLKILLPPGTKRFSVARRAALYLGILSSCPDQAYAVWVERTEPFMWTPLKVLKHQPLISIVVPVYNSPARYLLPMVHSVVNQVNYDKWELILVNASTSQKLRKLVGTCSSIDTRIHVINATNKGIAANTNLGINKAVGKYVGLLDHDDLLSPRALYEVACLLQTESNVKPQFIYSDEDKITDDGNHRFDVHFKPDWSPILLNHVNYINHFTVIEKELLNSIGGYRMGLEGAQDYDLYLRLADKKVRIAHIPKILYHWRASNESTASNFSTKKRVVEAGIQALENHLKRNTQTAKVSSISKQPGFYNISYRPKSGTRVAIAVLPTRNIQQYSYLVKALLTSLSSTKLQTQIFIGETVGRQTVENEALKIINIDTMSKPEFIREALAETRAEILIIFDAAAIPRSKSWIEDLSGALTQNACLGVVAPILMDPGTSIIRDAGLFNLNTGMVGLFDGAASKAQTYFGNTVWTRNVDYLSGRVSAIRLGVFVKYFLENAFYNSDELYDTKSFSRLLKDGFGATVLTNVIMDYYGELASDKYHNPNPNLCIIRQEAGLTKNINIPSQEEMLNEKK